MQARLGRIRHIVTMKRLAWLCTVSGTITKRSQSETIVSVRYTRYPFLFIKVIYIRKMDAEYPCPCSSNSLERTDLVDVEILSPKDM
jgi:hypothetical protein